MARSAKFLTGLTGFNRIHQRNTTDYDTGACCALTVALTSMSNKALSIASVCDEPDEVVSLRNGALVYYLVHPAH